MCRSEWCGLVLTPQRFGKIMGAGYVNELLARLQDKHPHDHTTTNRTLDADPATFPPGGQRVFVVSADSLAHDNINTRLAGLHARQRDD